MPTDSSSTLHTEDTRSKGGYRGSCTAICGAAASYRDGAHGKMQFHCGATACGAVMGLAIVSAYRVLGLGSDAWQARERHAPIILGLYQGLSINTHNGKHSMLRTSFSL